MLHFFSILAETEKKKVQSEFCSENKEERPGTIVDIGNLNHIWLSVFEKPHSKPNPFL